LRLIARVTNEADAWPIRVALHYLDFVVEKLFLDYTWSSGEDLDPCMSINYAKPSLNKHVRVKVEAKVGIAVIVPPVMIALGSTTFFP
jgi:hypothetical protein